MAPSGGAPRPAGVPLRPPAGGPSTARGAAPPLAPIAGAPARGAGPAAKPFAFPPRPTPARALPAAAPSGAPPAAPPAAAAAPAARADQQPPAAPAAPARPAPAATASSSIAAAATPGASPSAGGADSKRPINPFLANDPNQKARRLARALVSDMVAYQPQKRDEGLRDGTLKQLFREEIKKSYEEYVDQVGKEFADGTAHFQEALNEVLAGGKRIF